MAILYFIQFFIIASLISFAGSLQLGPVNMSVIYTAINKDHRSAIRMAIGGSLPELFYAAAAFWFSGMLQHFPIITAIIQYAIPPVFIVVGLYLFFQKVNTERNEAKRSNYSFITGFILGGLNPMLLPFWVFVIEYLKTFGINAHNGIASKAGFILGTAWGAFMLLFSIAYFIKQKKNKFRENFLQNANKITGTVFVLIGLLHLIKLLSN